MGKEREGKERTKKKGRTPCCAREGVRKGAWTTEEDKILVDFITQNGHGTWRNLPKLAGLLRCGKSCRLRWTNYLRPDIKRGPFSPEEEDKIIRLHGMLGNKWASIASHLPERTDNDVKNFWNSHLRKRFTLDHPSSSSSSPPTLWESLTLEAQPSDTPKSKGDYFLCLWNSNVGESFRKSAQNSQASSLTKAESASRSTNLTEQKAEAFKCKKEPEDHAAAAAYSDYSSYEMDDSSDAMMKLLLDFPVGDNDIGFLEPTPDDHISAYK